MRITLPITKPTETLYNANLFAAAVETFKYLLWLSNAEANRLEFCWIPCKCVTSEMKRE